MRQDSDTHRQNLRRYRVRYADLDPGSPVWTTAIRAWDALHAEEVFWDQGPDNDWEIISVEEIGDLAPRQHRGAADPVPVL